jgi:hypothetical protein
VHTQREAQVKLGSISKSRVTPQGIMPLDLFPKVNQRFLAAKDSIQELSIVHRPCPIQKVARQHHVNGNRGNRWHRFCSLVPNWNLDLVQLRNAISFEGPPDRTAAVLVRT